MPDVSNSRRNSAAGFDRILMALAATFLSTATLSTAAMAQSGPARSPADLAIDAAVPVPEPANVPPPTAADIKLPDAPAVDVTAKKDEPAPRKEEAAAPAAPAAQPAETAAAPAAAPAPAAATAPAPAAAAAAPAADSSKTDTAKTDAAKSATVVADQPAADRLRDLIATKGAKYFDRKAERTAVENFYKDRNYAPLWSDAAGATARAKSVMARLKDAAADGLDPADYPLPDFAAASSPEAQADAELRLTESMLDYARHAQSGRMHWSRVSGDISYPEHPIDPLEVLINVSTAKDASAALEGYNPQHKGYLALRSKLAELRGTTEDASKRIAEGDTLKFVKPTKKAPNPQVMEDARVPALRAKLNIAENPTDTRYDAAVANAVRKFQAHSGLKATGLLDNVTVRALNAPKSDRQIDIVRANMERWRWLPRDLGAKSLGDAYVILNIPDYSLKLMHNGKPVWTTRVVVGKPGTHATPLLTETMKFITVNPTWNVPPSIIYNEYLPALEQDPTVLERMGLKLARGPDGSVRISQPPGERNALGRIRFNFPNKFLVYQHDTPDKHLFAKEERAFSHGCMRVQNPDQYAANLLGIALPNERYTPEKIRAMYGSNEININFPTPIPVNLTYQTAFVDDAGKLEFRKDIYGRDAAMIPMLKGAAGKELETAVSRSQPNYVRPANVNIPGESYASNSGLGFFERLFGAPTPPPAAVRGQRRVVR
jgi:murein L,D-transpeptidase YcbB/YkuD